MYELKFHGSLNSRWHEFPRGRRILMIASELQRAWKMLSMGDRVEAVNAYERAFELLDLTLSVDCTHAERYELLRFRELLGHAYLNELDTPGAALRLLNVLISLNADAYRAMHGT